MFYDEYFQKFTIIDLLAIYLNNQHFWKKMLLNRSCKLYVRFVESANRKHHYPETTVINHIMLAVEIGNCITSVVLEWVSSYIGGRSLHVYIDD